MAGRPSRDFSDVGPPSGGDPRRENMDSDQIADMVLFAMEREEEREEELQRARLEQRIEAARLRHDAGGPILDVPVGDGRPPRLTTTQKLRRARRSIGAPQRVPQPPAVQLGAPRRVAGRPKGKLGPPRRVRFK